MLHAILEKVDRLVGLERAKAHCDVPCGIYDPIVAQISALTVIRMVDLMRELAASGSPDQVTFHNTMARYVAVKEEHAERAKHEVRVIWGDFVKPEHAAEHPGVHDLVHRIMKLGSRVRQTVDREASVEFLEAINEFAEIFWKIKGVPTKRAKAPYAPGEEVVYPAL